MIIIKQALTIQFTIHQAAIERQVTSLVLQQLMVMDIVMVKFIFEKVQ